MSDEGTNEGTQTGDPTGAQPPAWLSQMPADLKGNEAFTGFKTIGDLGKSYLDLRGKASETDGLKGKLASAILKPGENATQEEVSAFRKALGVPEKAEEYELPATEGVEQGEEMAKWSRDTFHKLGLTKEQGAKLSQKFDQFVLGMNKATLEQVQREQEAANTALKDEWKGDFEKNVEITKRAFAKFGAPLSSFVETTKLPDGTALGNHPVMIKAFYEIGKLLLEPGVSPGGSPAGEKTAPGMTYNMPSFG